MARRKPHGQMESVRQLVRVFKDKAFRKEIRQLMRQYFHLRSMERFRLKITPMNRDKTVIRIKEWME